MNKQPPLFQFLQKRLLPVSLVLFCCLILAISIRGKLGNPTPQQLNSDAWKDNGPLELSPDRGRFALTYSLIENHSYQFSNAIGLFAMPDVAMYKNRFVSLFAPTVSYIVMPGYLVGRYLGASQVGSFAMIAIFAVINFILIRSIAIRLGANPIAASVGGLLFLFASPAFPYAVTLYQHHISTFLILMSVYSLLRWKNNWALLVVWFLCALSISVDNPNLFLMFPIGIFALGRLIRVEDKMKDLQIHIHLKGLLTFLVMIPPILFFLYFNKMSYGNPFQLAGTVASAEITNTAGIDTADIIAQQAATSSAVASSEKKNALSFFQTRRLPNGFFEHFLSLDRGMVLYTPILIVGVLGVLVLLASNKPYTELLLGVIGADVLLYSMWGDPYGGWAFGSRYLIPTYALLAIFLAIALTKFRKRFLLLASLFVLSIYCIGVNTIGALTSNRNPPKIEVLALEATTHRRERYTYTREMEMLYENQSKSFVYNETPIHLRMNAWQFTIAIVALVSSLIGVLLAMLYFSNKNEEV